ncbi:MAG: glutamine--fructose-6-phosphate transaminase (isomerizing) [Rhodospirillaceae bacterium]|jgi:glucosamine--fructose-6-phosphate aminotransferase (isomerizing)|nr:glutamine--fructose-6-phosphate transaminase (isomerizing) [Rhodospirillaceae bacterium]
MCGIIGIVGKSKVAPLLLNGLRRLEYRGYDSSGIATIVNGNIDRRRAQGKLDNLEKLLTEQPIEGTIGIGHTRWATHGVSNKINAHPHATKYVAVVHNGIIENYLQLRNELIIDGYVFETDTDTETVVHLISHYLINGDNPKDATIKMLKRIEGTFALGIIFAGYNDLMIATRRGSLLAIGYGDGEMYLGSDALALATLTKKITYLSDGDLAVLSCNDIKIHDYCCRLVVREIKQTAFSGAMIGKGEYRHFMQKEIYEQPQVIGDTLNTFFNPVSRKVSLPSLPFSLSSIERITIIACGTSFYAGMVAKYWMEQLARISVEVDIASEFRYRTPNMSSGDLALFISQSGETADTIAALRYCKSQDQRIISLVNVPESTLARESDVILQTVAGPEIGVASTKAFTAQLTALACLTLALARAHEVIDHTVEIRLSNALIEIPTHISKVLTYNEQLCDIAENIANAHNVLYLGRGTSYPIALEGALKLKEISYIHAEGYAAGEIKHGPIALIDETIPVVVIAPSDELYKKTMSSVQEVISRGGRVIFLSDKNGIKNLGSNMSSMVLPHVDPFVTPILYAIPIQLLAYHVAIAKGTDVDQPRNLAKSVTVE